MKKRLPMNLQFFAEPGDGGAEGTSQNQQSAEGQRSQTVQFDYEKLASIVAGKQSVTEDSVLKGYFKQQGLSEEEMKQAISTFKQQKAANQPDVNALQQQATLAQQQAQQAIIERDAYLLSGELGVDMKTMPYLMKMADLTDVMGADAKVDQEKLKAALNSVLEALPQLKQQPQQSQGFRFGASGGTSTESSVDQQLDRIFGIKK